MDTNKLQIKNELQKSIDAGRSVLLLFDTKPEVAKIRFNNKSTKEINKWRLIVDGFEHLVKEVIFNCNSETLTEELPNIGIKHHVVCKSKSIKFENNIAYIY